MAGTHPEADVTMVRVAGGPAPGPAIARLPRLRGALINIFLVWPRAWCLVPAGAGVWSLPICASSSSGLSLHCFACNLLHLPII